MLLLPRVPVSPRRKRAALAIAVVADFIQLAGWWAFIWGGVSPADDILDVIVAVVLVLVLGLRWQIVLAFAAELVPGLALFPTWTTFVLVMPTHDPSAPVLTRVPPIQTPTAAAPSAVTRVPPRLPAPPAPPDAP
jgi:hypothetical protein